MIDEEIEQDLKALEKIFNHETIFKVKSHIYSLQRKIEDLKASRDKLKIKLEELTKK